MSEQRDREDTTILFVTLVIFRSAESAMQLLACGCSPKKSPKICPLTVPLRFGLRVLSRGRFVEIKVAQASALPVQRLESSFRRLRSSI